MYHCLKIVNTRCSIWSVSKTAFLFVRVVSVISICIRSGLSLLTSVFRLQATVFFSITAKSSNPHIVASRSFTYFVLCHFCRVPKVNCQSVLFWEQKGFYGLYLAFIYDFLTFGYLLNNSTTRFWSTIISLLRLLSVREIPYLLWTNLAWENIGGCLCMAISSSSSAAWFIAKFSSTSYVYLNMVIEVISYPFPAAFDE